jgi:methylamine---glutamate N-methyltransferase subunit B
LGETLAALANSASVHPYVQDMNAVSARITGADGQDYVGTGLADFRHVTVEGTVGKFAFCGIDNCECTLQGDAGEFCGHSIASGMLVVKGSVGDGAGAMGMGGLIAVYGSAGNRAGVSLRGADLLVRGNVGAQSGLGMRHGALIIGGSAGEQLGHGMRGGAIYLRGEAASLSPEIEEHRLREPDRLKLGLLLLQAGIKSGAGKEFRVYRPRVESGAP